MLGPLELKKKVIKKRSVIKKLNRHIKELKKGCEKYMR